MAIMSFMDYIVTNITNITSNKISIICKFKKLLIAINLFNKLKTKMQINQMN